MNLHVLTQIHDIDAETWNRLGGASTLPHLRHEFLSALEDAGCLGEEVGWLPEHFLFKADGRIVGAMPCYRKLNSFGEFVFDWAWAGAYEQAGVSYFPKLVVASPFTPATGPRLLLAPDAAPELAAECIDLAIRHARDEKVSSCHWLFATDHPLLDSPKLMLRLGCQFHWQNRGYRDFDDYLSHFSSKKRKAVRKERRDVAAAGISLRRVPGDLVTPAEWRIFHQLYRRTFAQHGNYPALRLAFFERLGATMGKDVLLVFAEQDGEIVAASFFLVGADTLYGRYWGCFRDIPSLHFEACYYQGLDYCIERGLQRFEPGAQGEHKISRGFLPTPTYSLHWIADERFRHAIADYLRRETPLVRRQIAELTSHTPFHRNEPPC